MIRFSREKVLLLHQLLAQETGGSIGLRHNGLSHAAGLDSETQSLRCSKFGVGQAIYRFVASKHKECFVV